MPCPASEDHEDIFSTWRYSGQGLICGGPCRAQSAGEGGEVGPRPQLLRRRQLLSLPKLLDVCVLYGADNMQLLQPMLSQVRALPGFRLGLLPGFSLMPLSGLSFQPLSGLCVRPPLRIISVPPRGLSEAASMGMEIRLHSIRRCWRDAQQC